MSWIMSLDCHALEIGIGWLEETGLVLAGMIIGGLLGWLITRRRRLRPMEKKIKRLFEILESQEMSEAISDLTDHNEERAKIARAWRERKEIA